MGDTSMSKGRMVALVAAGVVAGGVLAGTVGANAVGGSPTPAPGAQPGQPGDPGRPPRPRETPLTGDTAEKVKAAVLAKYPGATFVRVETDSDGAYEAHITTSDGKAVTVEVGKDFAVTGEEEGGPGFGWGGPGRGPHGTPLTGDALAKVKAAVAAKYPGATVDDAHADRDGSGYDALVTKKDGTHAVVELDKAFRVTGEHAGGPGRGPGPGPHGAPLAGDALAKVKAAVSAKYPGATVDVAQRDRDGSGYDAFITKKDGSHAAVELDKDFTVTGERSPRGPR